MTDVERYDPDNHPVPLPEFPLSLWADEFLATARISAELARTRFVPESLWVFRKRDGQDVFDAQATTAQVTAVIVSGRELGLGPMAALRSIDVINGTPALRAVTLRAILLAHGHDIWVVEATNNRATVSGQRAGSDRIQSIEWTMDDAKKRNLDGKPNWRKMPRNMLVARATGDVARLVAADALLGIPYTVEELEDGVDGLTPIGGSTGDGTPAPARRTRRPKLIDQNAVAEKIVEVIQRQSPDSPPLDEQPAAAAEQQQPTDEPELDPDDAGPDPISEQQSKLLHLRLRERFGTDRDAWLTHISETVGRPVDSTSDLNVSEASLAIDSLTPGPNTE